MLGTYPLIGQQYRLTSASSLSVYFIHF